MRVQTVEDIGIICISFAIVLMLVQEIGIIILAFVLTLVLIGLLFV